MKCDADNSPYPHNRKADCTDVDIIIARLFYSQCRAVTNFESIKLEAVTTVLLRDQPTRSCELVNCMLTI